jgi:hypothetical protein
MKVILVDADGNFLRNAWTLAGCELYYDGKITYRRTGKFDADRNPIFKKV